MAIPKVGRQLILEALEAFDNSLRNTKEWQDWDKNKTQAWAIEEADKLYPPKKIISLATGVSVNSFSGGTESNTYLAERGITVRRLRETKLNEILLSILEQYHHARTTQKFGGNHTIKELFGEARRILEESEAVRNHPNIQVVSSYGKGNWATIPWISLLDRRETETTQEGTYVVYLFREDGKGVYLSLAQGVTALQNTLGVKAIDVLEEQALKIHSQCSSLGNSGFDLSSQSDLCVDHKRAKLYEASTVAAKYYPADAIPSQAELLNDLHVLLVCYTQYVLSHSETIAPIKGTQPLALLGSWKNVIQEVETIRRSINSLGAWASFWSFPLREEAQNRLIPPFHLYAYIGKNEIGARITVTDFVTSKGNSGIVCPWPEITPAEFRDKTKASEKGYDIFKTWFKVTDIEILTPAIPVSHFDVATGFSSANNLINQNTFGYIFDDEIPLTESASQSHPLTIIPPKLPIQWLTERTGLSQNILQEMLDSLTSTSSQILLAGPPGTSKTWVAKQLALYLTRNRRTNTRFVQFHPTYSYESFVEGLRPVIKNGAANFEVTPGVVLDHVALMRKEGALNQESNEYVIIIDEANRANLPKVLGEMMFLFEYRNESIQLQYSPEFQLPKNLRFIATMNTADRSIRSIDIALRRRFDVFEFPPSVEILDKYYHQRAAIPDLLSGFESLNEALTQHLDRHHTIGHAFFMRENLDHIALRQIWERRVYPLIEEFFFDQPEIVKEFSIEQFWPSCQ